MHISQESPEQTERRLQHVLAHAQWVVHPLAHAFVEVAASDFPTQHLGDALAFVRDEDVWSALVPATSPEQEAFLIFSFHFPAGLDNSGFVGWLASHLKQTLGTGVMVVCGQNSQRGGIFDHWGAPMAVADAVVTEIQRLRQLSASPLQDTPPFN